MIQALNFPLLPLVLAGPVLRRVELGADKGTDTASPKGSVTVWLALKEPRTVTLEVYAGVGTPKILTGTRATVPLGPNLHLVAVTATGPKLTPATVYCYNVLFSASAGDDLLRGADASLKGGNVATTRELALKALTYHEEHGPDLPSFVTPPLTPATLRVFHASCRKPHAEGEDALSILDEVQLSAVRTGGMRPQQLLLTGDQIYADDVADGLLALCIDRGKALLGYPEEFPELPVGAHKYLWPGWRQTLVKQNFAMSSTDAKSHLIRFSEFVAMYLMVWSDVLWPESTRPMWQGVFGTVNRSAYIALGGPDGDWLFSPEQYEKQYEEHKSAGQAARKFASEAGWLHGFRDRLFQVRRALANTPTYTMFDDHEISDDWYIALRWCREVDQTLYGRTLIRNGLAAYAAFQAWGNTPERFEPGTAGAALLGVLDNAVAHGAEVEKRVGLPTGYANGLPQRPKGALEYAYTIDFPSHQLVVLDTRTYRAFLKGDEEPAYLIDDTAMNAMLGAPAPEPAPEKVVLLVSPAPVLGNQYIEGWAQPLIKDLGKYAGLLWKDVEAWGHQRHAFERLISKLFTRAAAGPDGVRRSRVVALSGDVHYGFAIRMAYDARTAYDAGVTEPVQGVLAQMVSSSLKNESSDTKGLHAVGRIPTLGGRTEMRVGWRNPSGAEIELGTQRAERTLLNPIPLPYTWTAKGTPAVEAYDADLCDLKRKPDWWYELTFHRHAGPDTELPSGVDVPAPVDFSVTNDRAKALAYYVAASDNHDGYRVWGTGKVIVGRNNIGEIQFKWGAGDAKTAIQTLWWRMASARTAAPLTRYEVPLSVYRPVRDPSTKGS